MVHDAPPAIPLLLRHDELQTFIIIGVVRLFYLASPRDLYYQSSDTTDTTLSTAC
jgi:hypothetical protein